MCKVASFQLSDMYKTRLVAGQHYRWLKGAVGGHTSRAAYTKLMKIVRRRRDYIRMERWKGEAKHKDTRTSTHHHQHLLTAQRFFS